MAEVLGAVASGFSIAQLAGAIIKTGFRIKNLLDEVQDIPGDLRRHLGQIQILAPLLAEIDHGPSISNGALTAAAEQCQQAAEELSMLAADLSRHVESSRGFNRQFRALQATLQKRTIARYEKRMEGAIQMLMLALQLTSLCRQNDLFRLQQSQPGIIAAEIVGSLAVTKEKGDLSKGNTLDVMDSNLTHKGHRGTGPRDRAVHKHLGRFQPTTTIGMDWLTGSVEIQTFDHAPGDPKQGSEDNYSWCRFRVRLPRWLSEKALDSFLYKESQSWKYILTPYNLRKMDDALEDLLRDITWRDDVQELNKVLQSGEISLGDHFIEVLDVHRTGISPLTGKPIEKIRSREISLFSILIRRSCWKLCNYLEGKGVATTINGLCCSDWRMNDANFEHRRLLLQKLDYDMFLLRTSLGSFIGSIEDFMILRQSIWPDVVFLDDSFAASRIKIASEIVGFVFHSSSPFNNTLDREKVRHFLFYQGPIRCDNISTYGLDTLSWDLGTVVGSTTYMQNYSKRCIWTELWREVMLAGLNRVSPHGGLGETHEVDFGRYYPPWLHGLLVGAETFAFHHRPAKGSSYSRYKKFDAAIHEAIQEYLLMVQTCGADPMPWTECGFWPQGTTNPFIETEEITIYCIGISYGPNPEDWRVWLADDMLSYAGDFWELVDPRPLWMPGGWVEEDMGFD